MADQKVRVLVVDDSAYVRKVISQMLNSQDGTEVVGTARDATEALALAEELRPDVITCDLIMPGVDGVEFIRQQMERRPVPIVVVSIAAESAERVLAALEAGAVDFIQKPTALATEKLLDMAKDLHQKIKAAAAASVGRVTERPPVAVPSRDALAVPPRADLIAIGVSTGGPQALRYLMPQFPADFPVPIAVVLHMPVGYTEMYAHKLDELTALRVVEAQEGTPVEPGRILLAQAGRHLSLARRADGRVVCHLDVKPLDALHRPSVDVLFQSAAEVYGPRVIAVVMTGMGSDGRDGAAWIKARGGTVLTESEQSCVVYGMPRAVVESGLSDCSVPLERLAVTIGEHV